MSRRALAIIFISFLFLTSCRSSAQTDQTQAGGAGAQTYIENKGSDTLVNLAMAWAESYQHDHPEVQISVTGGGSGTGFAALINGTIDIANASRDIKDEEIAAARKAGIEPVEFIVANDAIAVVVHPDNPVTELTLEQVARIYKGEYSNWSELGGEDRPIVRLSRETNSGTHVYFLETVIRLGSSEDKSIFSADTLLLPSSEGIIAEVSDNPNAIGYDGLGYITPEVKTVALARTSDGPFIMPSKATVITEEYPISRHLFMYSSGQPDGVVREFLDWILSSEGQSIVTDLGFVPIIPVQ
jgi:phosphate transport system substrate-binding protein